VLVIDGKNSNEDGILAAMIENKKATMIESKIIVYKLRRNSTELHTEHKCAPGLRLTSFPKLSRDGILRNTDETQTHQDS